MERLTIRPTTLRAANAYGELTALVAELNYHAALGSNV